MYFSSPNFLIQRLKKIESVFSIDIIKYVHIIYCSGPPWHFLSHTSLFLQLVSIFFFSIGLDFYVHITTDHPTLQEKCRLLLSGIPFGPPVLLGSHLGGRFIACLLCCRVWSFFSISILENPFPSFLLPESSVSSLLVCEYIC